MGTYVAGPEGTGAFFGDTSARTSGGAGGGAGVASGRPACAAISPLGSSRSSAATPDTIATAVTGAAGRRPALASTAGIRNRSARVMTRLACGVQRSMCCQCNGGGRPKFRALAQGGDRGVHRTSLAPDGEANDAQDHQGSPSDDGRPPGIEIRQPAVHLRLQ